jgi:hypothetical protein
VSRHFSLPVFLSFILVIAGCGGGSSNSGGGGGGVPGINVVVTSPVGPAAADDNQTLSITVQVQGDNGNAGVTWSVGPVHKGDPAGTLSNVQATSVTYNPPANLAAPEEVTVLATSVADPTRSAAIPVSLYPTPAITTQTSDLDVGFVGVDYNCYIKPIPSAGMTEIPCAVNVSGGMGPYTWSVSNNTQLPDGMSLAPSPGGLISPNATVIFGPPTQIGPDPIVGVHQFNLTATDSLGVAANVSLSITVAPSQLKVVTPTLLTTVQDVPYTPVALQATGGVSPYTWSIASGSASLAGTGLTLSPTGVISGTPTGQSAQIAVLVKDSDPQSPVPAQAVYPAPVAAPNGNIIKLQKPDDQLLPCVAGTKPAVQLNAPYAFLFTGFDEDGPVTISGSFTADSNGNISGVEDVIRAGGTQIAQPLAPGSSVSFNPQGRGCLTLNTSTSSAQFQIAATTLATGQAGTFYSDGWVLEFDDQNGTGTRGTGFLRIQDSTAFSTNTIAGPYALRFSGWNEAGGHFAMAGTATAASGLFTSVAADVNNAGAVSAALTGGSGTIGAVDGNGRGTATIGIGSSTYDLIVYVVDANHLIFNSTGPATSGHPLITGEATTSAGPFSQSTLNNSHIYRLSGSIPGSPDLGIGVLHFDGVNALSGTAFARSGGTATTTTLSGQFAVDPTTGRFTFSGTSVPAVGYAIPAASGITGYLVGTASSAASGVMEFQTTKYPPGYPFSPIGSNRGNGIYGMATEAVMDPQTAAFAGYGQLASDGTIRLLSAQSYLDSSRPAGLVPFQEFALFRYTWSADGSGTFGGDTYMVFNDRRFFYIDTSPFNGAPAVVVGQSQQ